MALKMVVDSLDGLDTHLQQLYVKQDSDGKFYLDVDGKDKKTESGIPKLQYEKELQKRKETETALTEIADSLVESIPEEMRDLIPDLPPAAKVKWIKAAMAKGVFDPKAPADGIDTKRPGSKQTGDMSNLTPHMMMARGYKTK